jgi:hypothetical protein
MPPDTPEAPRQRLNPAAAALGVGIRPDKWTIHALIPALIARYLQLVQQAEEQKQRGRDQRSRLYYAGAFEMAQLLAEYYQDCGQTEEYAQWEHRRTTAQNVAYRVRNSIAEAIGTPSDPAPPPPPSSAITTRPIQPIQPGPTRPIQPGPTRSRSTPRRTHPGSQFFRG